MTSQERNLYLKLLEHAAAAAREAGNAILDVYNTDFDVERKEDNSPLTKADKRSHEIIVARLSDVDGIVFPVLSEEGRDIPYEVRKDWDYFWLVDPLDGTKEFVKRNGEFTVNIALVRRDRPVLGVIYLPVKGMLYYGSVSNGVFREDGGKRERLPLKQRPERFTVAGSRSHGSGKLESFIAALKVRYSEIDVISAGSALKFCLVAEGRADVYPRFGPTMEWDTAAGHIIVEESGGAVSKSLTYNKPSLLNGDFLVAGPRYGNVSDLDISD